MKKKSSSDFSTLPLFQTEDAPDLSSKEIQHEGPFSHLSDMLSKYQVKEKNKYVSTEFQEYGCRLAAELDDFKHASLYIRLAKTVERGILESARSFVSDSKAKSKARLFLWKMGELRGGKEKNISPKKRVQKKGKQTTLLTDRT